MTEQRRIALKELQKLDVSINDARDRIGVFDPLFEEIEEPALLLESELGTSRTRLKEMKLESRRLESSSDERRQRVKKLEERIGSVRNLREESAVTTELEMVKRALENDETEALTLIDQVRKGEERVAELEEAFKEASDIVEPKKDALLAEREELRSQLSSLEKERESFTAAMDLGELRIYEAIRGGGRRRAIDVLTGDGACSNCFSMVPLQQQTEIRHGDKLIRCEACGVILAASEPVDESAPDAVDDQVITTGESGVDAREELSSEEITDEGGAQAEEALDDDGGDEEG